MNAKRGLALPLLAALSLARVPCALAQDADWSALQREATPSLQIRWRVGESGNWRQGPAEIRKGEPLALHVDPVVGGPEGTPGPAIRWYQIVPDTRKFYKNANFPRESDAYKWVGFGEIPCIRRELTAWRGRWDVKLVSLATSRPNERTDLGFPEAGPFYHADLGSFWFDVEVLSRGRVLRSPGLQEATSRGLSTKVFRLSVRHDDSLLGWLTSFFNVPGLFGSIPWQSENYIGVDCADCLAAAWSKWRKRPLDKDWNVAGIVAAWPKVKEFDIAAGAPTPEIRWTSDVKPGDFIAVRYAGRRQYQHIGALYADANKDGRLDPDDLVIHAGPEALQISPLKGGSFDGHVSIIRAADR